MLERRDGRALVQQEALSRLMMFSKRIYLVLDITEGPAQLVFRDWSGRSFRRYEGAWTIAAEHGGTHVTYELVAEPSFDVPEFILKRLLSRDSGAMITGLQEEMAARGRKLTVEFGRVTRIPSESPLVEPGNTRTFRR